jgi:hypothetical protein
MQDSRDSKTKIQQTNECTELKNIKYKSMMLKNNQKRGDAAMQMLHNTSATNSITHIENYLEREREHNISEPWGKLDKTVKIAKINTFSKAYATEHGLSDSDSANLVAYLVACIDHKKIVKTKDVIYDKITGSIVSIPVLTHVTISDSGTKFTLRRCDKRQSTLKSLPTSKQKQPVVILSSHTHTHTQENEVYDDAKTLNGLCGS